MGVIEGVDGNTVTVRVDGKTVEVSRPQLLRDMDVNPTQTVANPALLAADAKKHWWQFWKGSGYKNAFGPVFMDSKVNPLAAQQGYIGDCWFISAMGATARQQPDQIRRLILDNGNGTFDVTLYIRQTGSDFLPSTKTVNLDLPHSGGSMLYARPEAKETQELWAALLEKRYAMEEWNLREPGDIGFMRMDGGYETEGLEALFGKRASRVGVHMIGDEDLWLRHMREQLDAGNPLTTSTSHAQNMTADSARQADRMDIVLGHAYVIESVDVNKRTLTIHNPHGSKHKLLDLPIAEYRKYFAHYTVGGI